MEDAGRWSLIRRKAASSEPSVTEQREATEQIARTLLKRYGVVFWRLLAREAEWLPPWRDLLMAYRRLETRGEIRGGRLVGGFGGEQFALPDAVGRLRAVRKREKRGELVALSAADPLNLVGILTPDARVAAIARNRVLYDEAVLLGGTRYPIGSLEFDHSDWRRHYGPVWGDFKRAKRRYDPGNILSPGPGIF